MTDFDPGEGWREISDTEVWPSDKGPILAFYPDGDSPSSRRWVREEPVPALPTEPYTVIRVTWADATADWRGTDFMLLPSLMWHTQVAGDINSVWLADKITGFEVLSEPRAVTAKAVLDTAFRYGMNSWHAEKVAREFGVES